LVSAHWFAVACETHFRLATLDPALTIMSGKLILASGSPRRRQLLRAAGVSFELAESAVEERRLPQEPAREYALRMAGAKALAVARRHPASLVLGADTVVECQAEILEKPVDATDARRMLTILAGRGHVVITAFAFARDSRLIEAEAVQSEVFFRPLSETEIGDYIASGEPFDKAGAYGIQGMGGSFISRVEGPRDNVMGLPVARVLAALERCGIARPG
jgi:septum formation protein